MAQTRTIFISVFLSVAISLGVGYFYLQSQTVGQNDFDEKVVAVFAEYDNAETLVNALNAYAAKAQEEANKPQEVDFEISTNDAPMKGDADAPVAIVEFSEYKCPYCQRHALQTIPQLEQYIEAGTVKYYFRDYIVHGDAAELRSEIAHCVRDQKGDEGYFAMHDLLFSVDGFALEDDDNILDTLVSLATDNIDGVDGTALKACVEAETHADEIAQNSADAKEYGVTGTPSFFVNNYFVKGAYPFETFQEVIEAQLAD